MERILKANKHYYFLKSLFSFKHIDTTIHLLPFLVIFARKDQGALQFWEMCFCLERSSSQFSSVTCSVLDPDPESIRNRRIRMFVNLPDPDPSFIKQK
jgi:hypothetical protein